MLWDCIIKFKKIEEECLFIGHGQLVVLLLWSAGKSSVKKKLPVLRIRDIPDPDFSIPDPTRNNPLCVY
jgi:hypothetical protein